MIDGGPYGPDEPDQWKKDLAVGIAVFFGWMLMGILLVSGVK